MSARRQGDVAKLREAIGAFFQRRLVEAELFLPWSAQRMRGEIFASCEVLEERADGEGAFLRVRGEPETVARTCHNGGASGQDIFHRAHSPTHRVRRVELHQRVGLLDAAADDAARPVVLEAAPDDTDAAGEQRRGDRIAFAAHERAAP